MAGNQLSCEVSGFTFLESCDLMGEARSTSWFGTLGRLSWIPLPNSLPDGGLKGQEVIATPIFTVKCSVGQWWPLQRPTPSLSDVRNGRRMREEKGPGEGTWLAEAEAGRTEP